MPHLLAALGLALVVSCRNDTLSVPATVRLEEVASGLDFPVFLTAPPGDNARLFVVEKTGRIRIVKNGSLLPAPFLDLRSKVSNGSEQGLLGLAFHPEYAGNGRLVVNYTNTAGDTRIAVYRVSADPDVADAASEQVVLAVDQPYANHNGGMVAFGPDGKLYIGMGDGGSGGDPQGNGQNRGVLLGKLLRVELSGSGQLSVPADNPFVGQAGIRPEIWSYGLRNPWRFSFDRQTRDLYIGDVGQNAHEEIDASTGAAQFGRGLNYGWNRMEGAACYDPPGSCGASGLTLPVLDYGHGQGCSVTGGYVYRGDAVPAIKGLYFYADFCQGWVRSFRLSGTTAAEQRDWESLRPDGQITSFGEDARGELYLMTAEGRVFRIVAAPLSSGPDFARLRSVIPPGVRFGTSSWTYPGWKGLVYQRDYPASGASAEMLGEYARFPLFDTVGIDSSFYGPLTEKSLAGYAAALPPGFPCVSKVWDRITVHTFAKARERQRGGESNPDFLNAELFLSDVWDPLQRHFAAHRGPLVFEFQAIARQDKVTPQAFADRLDAFFGRLPPEGRYAVEVRNAEFLTPAYFAVLREHDVAHVLSSWTRMPSIGMQLDLPGALTAGFLVARALLRPGRAYAEAVDAFAPYDRIRDPNPELRADLVRLVELAEQLRVPAYILVNNRAEGSAPLTVAAVLELLAEKRGA